MVTNSAGTCETGTTQDVPHPVEQHFRSIEQSASLLHSLSQRFSLPVICGHSPSLFTAD